MIKPTVKLMIALLLIIISPSLRAPNASRAPATITIPIYLSQTPQASFVKLPKLFEFYANLFEEINSHGDVISGEDFEKTKHFINGQIKSAQLKVEFHAYLERDIVPYLKDLPTAALRLQNSSLYLSELTQKFYFLAEILETQVSIFRNQGLISLAKDYVEILNSQAVAESLTHLMHNRGENNSSSFFKTNAELSPYVLKLLILKTSEQVPQNFTIPRAGSHAQNPNSLVNFSKIVSHIEFQSGLNFRGAKKCVSVV